MSKRLSGLQKDVLLLYRSLLKSAKKKDKDNKLADFGIYIIVIVVST
jgi:hypothetical protein